jgi:hypothetical protein
MFLDESLAPSFFIKTGGLPVEKRSRDQAIGRLARQLILRTKIAETIQKSTNFVSWFAPPRNHYLLGNSINYTQDVVSCAAGQYKTRGGNVKPPIPEKFVALMPGDPNP